MPLAYYAVAAERQFWSEHWGGHSVEELLAIARTSPLTELVSGALPRGGRVLEAGCGLGQYVLLLRERGWPALGIDWSVEALAACRRAASAPLAAAELRLLPLRAGAVQAYVSLGVMEHDPDGPDALLAEARRVLAPGGTLVVSVPYVNGVRRLAAPYLRRRARHLRERGAGFYQYAFTRAELRQALARHGFAVGALRPYDPARLLRSLVRRPGHGSSAAQRGGGEGGAIPVGPRGGARRGAALARRLLYTQPALRLLGHMLLAVAVRQ